MSQILQFELILKGGAGLMLLLIPVTTARLLGFPYDRSGIWGRLLGAVMIGIAGAIYVEHDVEGARGLGVPGLILINIIGIFALLVIVIFQGVGSRRGAMAAWFTIAVLFSLSLLEIIQL